jgi:geranylgeranyl diphosphate synthase type II
MYSIKECQEIISEKIDQFKLNSPPEELYDPVNYVMSLGGKRIRPALVLMGCNLFSDDIEDAIQPALAIEIFHNFTLLHDDVMDQADVRRGHPTVHKKWDENVAILSGDAMLIKAYEMVSSCNNMHLCELLNIFNKTALQVCEGQQYDMNFEKTSDVSIAQYMKMIELKTGVLIAAALEIGSLTGNAPRRDAELLYNFGLNLGLTFQLQDDFLDVYGKSEVFGKNNGGDIASNKKTYLLIKALERADKDTKAELNYWLEEKKFDKEEKVRAVKNIFNQLNIPELTKAKIEDYYYKGLAALEKANVPDERKKHLKAFAEKILLRNK